MKFPHISHINDILPFIEANPQFRVQQQPNGTTVICYMLQDEDTFKGEHEQYAKECRGITFDTASGKILNRTLHKFENVGQSDASQPDQIPWENVVRIMDKRDGSMITPVMMPNCTVVCKTKKTFTSAEAIAATEFLHRVDNFQYELEWVKEQLLNGFTPTFEWTSPRFPIVLTYQEDALTLLHLRHNESGSYIIDLDALENCPFPIVQNELSNHAFMEDGVVSWGKLKHAAETTTGIEGWIVQTDDGEMWKIKTQWYIELHHAVTFTRWRDIAKTVVEDQSDDLKAAFSMTGRSIEPILKVERKVKERIEMERILSTAMATAYIAKKADAKTVAMELKGHPSFSNIMRLFRGGEIDWFDWYKKNHLKTDWDLEVVGVLTEDQEPPSNLVD